MKKSLLILFAALLLGCGGTEKKTTAQAEEKAPVEESIQDQELVKTLSQETQEINKASSEFVIDSGYYQVQFEDNEMRLFWISQGSGEDFSRLAHSTYPVPGEQADWSPIPPGKLIPSGEGLQTTVSALYDGETESYTLQKGETGELLEGESLRQFTYQKVDLGELYREINEDSSLLAAEESGTAERATPVVAEKELSRTELMAKFDQEEGGRDVNDDFRRFTSGTFRTGEFTPQGIKLTFDNQGEELILIQSAEYSPLETCPFMIEDSTYEPWINLDFILTYKGYYLEDEWGNDEEVKILSEYVEYDPHSFESCGVSKAYQAYEFISEFIEVLRDENWSMFEYILSFPYEIKNSPIGPVTLTNMDDFKKYRPYILTKSMRERIVNQQYGDIMVNGMGFALGRGDIWFQTSGKDTPFEIISINPSTE
ncbi:MAG: hypothetical protein JEY99_10175 [Spirochaetales bacterium]|nr:hypothetical protein [Spirochaetales bacterium]